MFSEMEYPHWMMVAGAWLVVAGFIGLGFSRYMNREPAEDNLHPAGPPTPEEDEDANSVAFALVCGCLSKLANQSNLSPPS